MQLPRVLLTVGTESSRHFSSLSHPLVRKISLVKAFIAARKHIDYPNHIYIDTSWSSISLLWRRFVRRTYTLLALLKTFRR
jgi:hypothetical protein